MKNLRVLIFLLGFEAFDCTFIYKNPMKSVRSPPERRSRDGEMCEEVKEVESDRRMLEVNTLKYIEQPVDHLNKKTDKKWMMRFMENTMFFHPDSPVYIYVGGPVELNSNVLREGLMYELAEETKGFMIATEYRYYGESKTKEDIAYLHSSQALEDLRRLILRVKEVKSFEKSKIVLVGEEHGASLAIWLKQKYPDLADAVIADTPLLVAKLEFEEFAEQVANNFIKFAPAQCLIRIIEIFDRYISLRNNTKELQKYSKSCPGVDLGKNENVHLMFFYKAILFKEAAENGLEHVHAACNYIDMDHKSNNNNEDICYNYNFNQLVEAFKNKEIPEHYQLYQGCNEFAQFLTSSFFPIPYKNMIPVEFYIKMCTGVFGFDKDHIEKMIAKTNDDYGGLKPSVTNVAFVHGELDPWKGVGVPKCSLTDNKYFLIPGGSHGKFLQATDEDTDSKALINIRSSVKSQVKNWIESTLSCKKTQKNSLEQSNSLKEKFLTLPVNHFDLQNTSQWNMRYMLNEEFFQPTSPIFVMISNQRELNSDDLVRGLMFDFAKETNGMMYATEHRYYGKSKIKRSLKYLHSSQVLLDLKIFLDSKKAKEKYKDSKIVLVGDEYGASLAVWLKQKYPDLVDAVIADTPLLLAELEFPGFAQQVADNFKQLAPADCVTSLETIFEKYSTIRDNPRELKVYSRACKQNDMSKIENQQLMFLYKGSMLKEAAEKRSEHINEVCNAFIQDHDVRDHNEDNFNICFNYDYRQVLNMFQNISSADHFNLYQGCNEFALFTTSSYFGTPYDDMIPLSFFIEICNKIFEFDQDHIENMVAQTNVNYGGLEPNVTQVAFVHGEIDPWKGAGIPNETILGDNKYFVIPGVSHGQFLKAFKDESEEIVFVRDAVKYQIMQWIGL